MQTGGGGGNESRWLNDDIISGLRIAMEMGGDLQEHIGINVD